MTALPRLMSLAPAVMAALLAPGAVCRADPPPTAPSAPAAPVPATGSTAPTPPPTTDDRIILSVDGSTLTNSNGGAGASAGWLHNFDADTLAGIAVEHQALANTQWTFGSLNGSKTLGTGDTRYSVYGDVHEGAGNDQGSFQYAAEAVGVIGSYFRKVSVQLEDKQLDILKSHGNLPKVGVSYQWDPHVATSASYAYTVGGNLGTQVTNLRIDETGPTAGYFAGGAFGTASPAVLNIEGFPLASGSRLREGYLGFSKPLPWLRGELAVVADYIHLSKTVEPVIVNSSHFTVTVNYILHLAHR